jgi:hypothetical protein
MRQRDTVLWGKSAAYITLPGHMNYDMLNSRLHIPYMAIECTDHREKAAVRCCAPYACPTESPTEEPTGPPSRQPSWLTVYPTASPSPLPTDAPTDDYGYATVVGGLEPSASPTVDQELWLARWFYTDDAPTARPTASPSASPSSSPTPSPLALLPTFVVEKLPSTNPTPSHVVDFDAPLLLGGDRDEHGCVASGGYQWCASSGTCMRPWEEPPCLETEIVIVPDSVSTVSLDLVIIASVVAVSTTCVCCLAVRNRSPQTTGACNLEPRPPQTQRRSRKRKRMTTMPLVVVGGGGGGGGGE